MKTISLVLLFMLTGTAANTENLNVGWDYSDVIDSLLSGRELTQVKKLIWLI